MIYTIGYGKIKHKDFIDVLQANKITDIIECRTSPYSKYRPEFNRNALQKALMSAGINYHYRGNNIGGKGKNVKYDETLNEIKEEYGKGRKHCALMCAEEDFNKCHRKKLADYLTRQITIVYHIYQTNIIKNIVGPEQMRFF